MDPETIVEGWVTKLDKQQVDPRRISWFDHAGSRLWVLCKRTAREDVLRIEVGKPTGALDGMMLGVQDQTTTCWSDFDANGKVVFRFEPQDQYTLVMTGDNTAR